MEKVSPTRADRKASSLLRQLAIFVLIIFALQRLYSQHRGHRSSAAIRKHSNASIRYPPERGYTLLYHESWAKLATALEIARPRMSGKLKTSRNVPGKSAEFLLEEDEDDDAGEDVVPIDIKSITALGIHHKRFVQSIEEKEIGVVYKHTKRGIVITGGLEDFPRILIQLRLLRRTNSKLPVEVALLEEDDYNQEVCLKLFAPLNARCLILEHLMSHKPLPFVHDRKARRTINSNEPLHKLLAMFFSSFEEVLLLGPDTLVYNKPDSVFSEEPFLSKGLVLWPDFWAATVSPKMSKIQHKTIPSTLDATRTIDLGQMIISKAAGGKALLLAIYYTYYGNGLYDVLLKQSKVGEAGSQAIKAAARFFETDFYMVKRYVEAVGYPDKDESRQSFRGVAMLQALPLEDYHKQHKDRHIPAFIRANNPPLNPLTIMKAGVTSFSKSEDEAHRMWEWFGGRYASNGWRDPDPERALWAEIGEVACRDLTSVPLFAKAALLACPEIDIHREKLGFKQP